MTGPYGFPINLFDLPVITRVPLEPERRQQLQKLRDALATVSAGLGEQGDDFIISALVGAMGDDATTKLRNFLVATNDIDARDLNAECQGAFDRLIVVKQPHAIVANYT